jgi:hypothetical protein
MSVNVRENILNSIISIQDKKTNESIPILNKELIFEKSMYSSTNEKIWHVMINNNILRKNTDIIITYICCHCNMVNIVGTTQFLRKIRQKKVHCIQCINSNKPNVEQDNIVFHEKSVEEFEKCNDVYKNSYLLSHLTEEDYERIRNRIISLGNGKYTDFENYEYWSIYHVNNQMRFSSVMYDKKNKCIFKANQPIIKCDNCTKSWRAKSLEGFKNDYKLLCNECKLCNRTFKIRPIKNTINETITYQSKLEKKFVDWCNARDYLVKNGPYIPYFFNGKSKIYRVDYQIADIIIEIKDFHIWHKNQIESGLWQTKLDAVNTYILENENKCIKKYMFITPNNWKQMIREISLYLEKNLDKI